MEPYSYRLVNTSWTRQVSMHRHYNGWGLIHATGIYPFWNLTHSWMVLKNVPYSWCLLNDLPQILRYTANIRAQFEFANSMNTCFEPPSSQRRCIHPRSRFHDRLVNKTPNWIVMWLFASVLTDVHIWMLHVNNDRLKSTSAAITWFKSKECKSRTDMLIHYMNTNEKSTWYFSLSFSGDITRNRYS